MGKGVQTIHQPIIAEALKPYQNIHARIDDIDERVNNQLNELFIPNFAQFMAALDRHRIILVTEKTTTTDYFLSYIGY